jgi:transcriptional regulator
MPANKSDVLQGTLDLLVLRTLDVRGALHGYAITQHIQRGSADLLRVEEGSLYPALHRLESRGLVTSQWNVSDTNRRVKTYSLTEAGRQQLRAEAARWTRFSAAVTRVLQARRPRTA